MVAAGFTKRFNVNGLTLVFRSDCLAANGPHRGNCHKSSGNVSGQERMQIMAGRLAIVLSGGGAKGAFQVGVLDALINKHGVKPKIVVGTSTGAIQALGVAQNDVAGLVAVWSAIKGNGDIYTGRTGIIGGLLGDKALYGTAPLRKLLKKFYDPAKIEASDIELRLGVVSLQSGEFQLVAQNAAGLDNWVYASCAMPVFFDPLQTSDKQQWVDGGVRDVTPLGAALDLEAERGAGDPRLAAEQSRQRQSASAAWCRSACVPSISSSRKSRATIYKMPS